MRGTALIHRGKCESAPTSLHQVVEPVYVWLRLFR